MDIFPAIDIRDGKAVRLLQGDYGSMTVYGDDTAAVARDFLSRGARFLHVVDLDGAAAGTPVNTAAIAGICAVDGLFVEVGGGIRTPDAVARCLDCGAKRVILGSAAVEQPDFLAAMLARYGKAIAVGVDARDGFVAINGWKQLTDRPAFELCAELFAAGVQTVIYTDISRDGMMNGTNLEAYRRLRAATDKSITASGGISSESDIVALREMGIDSAIVGKAIYEGALELGRVLALAAGEEGSV